MIKWIAGKPDSNDLNNINKHLKCLNKYGTETIKRIDHVTAVLQKLTNELSNNQQIIQTQIDDLQSHMSKLENDIRNDLLLQINYFQTTNLLQLLQSIERTITLIWKNVINLEIFTAENIQDIYQYLILNYQSDRIIPINNEIYSILKFSNIVVAQTKDFLIFLIKTPILSLTTGTLYQIYPIPNPHQIVLVPPTKYYITMENQHYGWTETNCPTIMNLSICTNTYVNRRCNLTAINTCITTKVVNKWSHVFRLPQEELLLDTSIPTNVIEDCNGQLSNQQLIGTYAIFSNCRIIINNVLFDQIKLYTSKSINNVSLFTSISDYEVKFHNYHLHDYSAFRKELVKSQETSFVVHTVTQSTHLSITFLLCILIVVLCFIVYHYRTYLHQIAKRRVIKLPKSQLPPDSDLELHPRLDEAVQS